MKIKEYKIISVIISSKYTVEDFQNQCNKLFVEGWDSLGDIRTIICHVKDNRETVETIHITREFVKYENSKLLVATRLSKFLGMLSRMQIEAYNNTSSNYTGLLLAYNVFIEHFPELIKKE